MTMEKLTAQLIAWITKTFGSILEVLSDKLLLTTEILANEWRIWFVLGVSIGLVNFVKKYIVHRSHPKRPLIIRGVTLGGAFLFSVYEFWDYSYTLEISVAIMVAVVPFYHSSRWIMRKIVPDKVMKSQVVKVVAPSKIDEEEDDYEGATMIGIRNKG